MVTKDSLSQEVFQEAKQSFIKGNYKVAEPIFQQLILQNTRNPEIYQMLATIYYDKGMFNKAIRTFKRALEIDPHYTDASVGLSIILNDLGRYEEGKEVFEQAQGLLNKKKSQSDPFLDEKIAGKHEELADLYDQSSRHQEALEQLFKAQKLSARKPEITLRIADCFEKLGDHERSLKELRHLIREYPQFNTARLRLGLLFYNSGNLIEATEQWENILLRDPQHSEALRYLKLAQAAGITNMSGGSQEVERGLER